MKSISSIFLSINLCSTLCIPTVLPTAIASAQTTATRPDPDIRKIVSMIDSARIEATIRKLVSFGTRNSLSTQTDPNRGIGAARDWLYTEFKRIADDSNGNMKVEIQKWNQPPGPRVPQTTPFSNVVATLSGGQGSDNGRMLVVSGHFDSMPTSPTDGVSDAPGANDDASGTAAVLEMARVMSKYKFRIPIVFMAVSGEEQGLIGATHFAEEAKKANLRIDAMFTNDIIGNSTGGNGVHDDKTVRVFAEGVPSDETAAQATSRRSVGGENDSASRQLARYIKEAAGTYVPKFKVQVIYRRDRYLRGGDHIPFLENGYAAVRFTEPNENYDHQHQNVRTVNGTVFGDLPEFVDFPYITQVARVNTAALASIASAPEAPRQTGIVTARLTNDTDLRWNPSTETDIAGYEIVWRDTDESYWTHSKFVGNVTTFTMKGLSKDNYFFGVRAVDKHGHKSIVSYPRPGR